MGRAEEQDPFAPIEASERFATLFAVVGAVCAVAAAVTGLAPVFGPIGMASGLIAHVKGSRYGMPSAVLAGLGMIVGMSVILYLR
ncbi:MAG: hypothetical protein R6V28_15285 [Nitriliruptoraceae bacterium]